MSVAFPNELLHAIFCDILATYVHSLVLLPATHDRWHAHYNLRRVSRHFKTLTDDIWDSAVGSKENWRDFGRLHAALCSGKYNPSEVPSSPLIRAYGAYIVGVILREQPQAKIDVAKQVYGIPDSGDRPNPYDWFWAGTESSHSVRPREFGYVLESWLHDTMLSEHLDDLLYSVQQLTNPRLHVMASAPKAAILQKSLTKLVEYLTEEHLAIGPTVLHRMNHNVIADLEEIGLQRPPSAQDVDSTAESDDDAETQNIAISRKRLSSSTALLKQKWFRRHEASQYRKAALSQAAQYGG